MVVAKKKARRRETTKETLHRVIDTLTEEQALDLLDYLNLQADPDTLSPEELKAVREGEAAIARGEYVTLEQLRRELDERR
jgi:hypothetical protein